MNEAKAVFSGSMMTTASVWVMMTNNVCLELWGPTQKKCGFSLHAFLLVTIIESVTYQWRNAY